MNQSGFTVAKELVEVEAGGAAGATVVPEALAS